MVIWDPLVSYQSLYSLFSQSSIEKSRSRLSIQKRKTYVQSFRSSLTLQYRFEACTMCKAVEILYGCGHPHSYPPVKECYAGFFPGGILCGRQNTKIVDSLTLAEYPYCFDYCFKKMKLEIEIDYLLKGAKLVEDARKVGWTEADIQGSHLDLEMELEQELNSLRDVCNISKPTQVPEHKSVPSQKLNEAERRRWFRDQARKESLPRKTD